MKFFLANVSRHDRNFNYRLPENVKAITQPVRLGQQVTLVGDHNAPQIDSLVAQVEALGGRRVGEYDDTKGKVVPYLYNVDAAIKVSEMREVMRHNTGQLVLQGKKMREAAAIATSQSIESMAPGTLTDLEMSIQEDSNPQAGEKPIAEGVRVDIPDRGSRNSDRVERRRRGGGNKDK